jgi:hypothetical protein
VKVFCLSVDSPNKAKLQIVILDDLMMGIIISSIIYSLLKILGNQIKKEYLMPLSRGAFNS